MPLNIAILASGRGSNFKAILQAIEAGHLDASIQCLICNVEGAPVIQTARQVGIPSFTIPHQGISREVHETQMIETLSGYPIDYLVLAGYMRLMTPLLLNTYNAGEQYRIINIHPSLLPAF